MSDSRVTRSRIASAALLAAVTLVLVSVLLPSTAIAWMRNHWPWFNQPMLWIEHANSAINLVHAVLFLALGLAVRLALKGWRFTYAALAFLMLGAMTEWAQFLVPGRHARLADVIVDVSAGVMGWLAACVLLYACRAAATVISATRRR